MPKRGYKVPLFLYLVTKFWWIISYIYWSSVNRNAGWAYPTAFSQRLMHKEYVLSGI